MDIIIMHKSVIPHDAIGNDIESMYLLLKKTYSCFVYAIDKLNINVEYIDRKKLDSIICRDSCIIIYHHSVFWREGYNILKKVRGKIIFKYHNITPPSFFKNYSRIYYRQCKKGRKQTEILIKKFPEAIWVSDSGYNARELNGVSEKRNFICPPFNRIEQWSKCLPDERLLKKLSEEKTINLLFVGRVAPNKGHRMLLDIIRVFCANYQERIKLRIIGKFDNNLKKYNLSIEKIMDDYKISDMIEFIGEVTDSKLMAYYLGSDMLICTSKHEGFCVPIIEAQFLGLPVLALNQCAVSETLGERQVIFDDDSVKFAAAIKVISDNLVIREYLSEQGKENFNQRFREKIIIKKFNDIIGDVIRHQAER